MISYGKWQALRVPNYKILGGNTRAMTPNSPKIHGHGQETMDRSLATRTNRGSNVLGKGSPTLGPPRINLFASLVVYTMYPKKGDTAWISRRLVIHLGGASKEQK